MPTPQFLILDRESWARGDNPTNRAERNQLLDERGCMCCLGFACGQAGVLPIALRGAAEPENIVNDDVADELIAVVPEWLVEVHDGIDDDDRTYAWTSNADLAVKAMAINDQANLTDERRVEALNELFGPLGVQIVLVDTPAQREALGGLPADFGTP